jgi:hypothetical protein
MSEDLDPSLLHEDDAGLYPWPYTKGRHTTPCKICDALEAVELNDSAS